MFMLSDLRFLGRPGKRNEGIKVADASHSRCFSSVTSASWSSSSARSTAPCSSRSSPPTCRPPLFPHRLRRRPRRTAVCLCPARVRWLIHHCVAVCHCVSTCLCARRHCLLPDPNRPHAGRPHSPIAYDNDHGGLSASGTRAVAILIAVRHCAGICSRA